MIVRPISSLRATARRSAAEFALALAASLALHASVFAIAAKIFAVSSHCDASEVEMRVSDVRIFSDENSHFRQSTVSPSAGLSSGSFQPEKPSADDLPSVGALQAIAVFPGTASFKEPSLDSVMEAPLAMMPVNGTTAASSADVASSPVENSHGFVQSRLSSEIHPVYPGSSRRNGEQGMVVLRVEISAEGKVSSVQVDKSSGFRRLDKAALEAIGAAEFVPAFNDGSPISSSLVVPIEFKLR